MKDKPANPSGKGARLSVHVNPAPARSTSDQSAHDLSLIPSYLRLQHLLVPIDFSETGEKALKYARRFAEQFGSKVTLLHVIQPVVYPADFGFPPTVVDTLDETMRGQIEQRLADLVTDAPFEAKTLVRVGQPYHEITTAARELDVDLIIITTHGRTGFKHVLLGSTAERVLRHAPCPVLTVREREHDFV